MARSRRRPYTSMVSGGPMQPWRETVNRRLRHRSKQLINACRDYDGLILPDVNEVGTLWDSPRDGHMRLMERPLLNECEWEYQESLSRGDTWRIRRYELDASGHSKYCGCYTNKRSWFWKNSRK